MDDKNIDQKGITIFWHLNSMEYLKIRKLILEQHPEFLNKNFDLNSITDTKRKQIVNDLINEDQKRMLKIAKKNK
ncbi:MAG: hypothetical protein FWD14_06400 [Treponema sp.]|nr:hypothetical protein [Treponema sp.]